MTRIIGIEPVKIVKNLQERDMLDRLHRCRVLQDTGHKDTCLTRKSTHKAILSMDNNIGTRTLHNHYLIHTAKWFREIL